MSEIRLISTDFDGTLIGHPSDGRCVSELAEVLCEFKARGGLWAINTGRSLGHAVEGVELFDAGVTPDFLLTNERELFLPSPSGGWMDYGDWNQRCRLRHAELFDASGGIFEVIESELDGMADVTIIEENGHPAGLITTDEEVMDAVVECLSAVGREHPDFDCQRNTIYLRFCHKDYHKGAVLSELGRLLRLETVQIFAIGDHHNDLSMLQSGRAGRLACPANAIPRVKEAVSRGGGHVAARRWGSGAAEAMRALGVV